MNRNWLFKKRLFSLVNLKTEYDFDAVYKAGKMNANADDFSRNPIVNEEKSRNLLEDDDDTFMISQEKVNLEETFMNIKQENNIKKGNNSKSEYFNSIFTQDDTDDLSESSQDPILNINPKFSETFNHFIVLYFNYCNWRSLLLSIRRP